MPIRPEGPIPLQRSLPGSPVPKVPGTPLEDALRYGPLDKASPWHWRIPFQLSTIPHRAIFNPQTKKTPSRKFREGAKQIKKMTMKHFKKKYPCNDLPFYRLSSCWLRSSPISSAFSSTLIGMIRLVNLNSR